MKTIEILRFILDLGVDEFTVKDFAQLGGIKKHDANKRLSRLVEIGVIVRTGKRRRWRTPLYKIAGCH